MPLHIHTTGEQVHTVSGSTEDDRLHADPEWRHDPADAPTDAPTDAGDGEENP